jgi:hypothetical protein
VAENRGIRVLTRCKKRKASNVSTAASPELELSQFFRKIYYSPRYSQYIAPRLGAGATQYAALFDAWYALCDEAGRDLHGVAIPVFWDGETKTASVCAVPFVLNKLDEGYVLIGFATISNQTKSHVLRAKQLPIFIDAEIATVIEVIKKASVLRRSPEDTNLYFPRMTQAVSR